MKSVCVCEKWESERRSKGVKRGNDSLLIYLDA